jgi:hypothetical protein
MHLQELACTRQACLSPLLSNHHHQHGSTTRLGAVGLRKDQLWRPERGLLGEFFLPEEQRDWHLPRNALYPRSKGFEQFLTVVLVGRGRERWF